MALTPGTRLGVYEVTAAIGEGGMGEVYRATDSNLKRSVAIKVLPASVAGDADRLARFQREAEVLAALNHPNIAAIYGLEKTPDFTALVMELVEGDDLSQRIARGAMPIDEALPIAKQIAEALEAAHEQGIIHRDLKPANIKVRADGTVKVLDFGLAKAVEPAAGSSPSASMSPTITSPAMRTGAGMILGTAAYMSPEQARGKALDKRADIWAFGAVLFEMLTGTRAFPGEDTTDTLAAVVRAEPEWSLVSGRVSPTVLLFLRRCLQKDVKQRVGDIRDVRLALEGAFETAALARSSAASASHPPRWRQALGAGAYIMAGVGVAAAAFWALGRVPTTSRPQRMRFAIVAQSLVVGNAERNVDVSPDGTHIVYAGPNGQLLVRAIDQLEAEPLRGITGAHAPFFSPDGKWIGFFQGSTELKKVAVTGGPPVTLCRMEPLPRGADWGGASWGSDDTIVFATADPATGLLRVPAGGGDPQVLTSPDAGHGERDHLFPSVLPGGRAVLFTITVPGAIDGAQIAVLDLATGQRKTLIRGGTHAQYVDTGHLVYAAGGTLRAVPFDLARLAVTGEAVPVAEQVMMTNTGAAEFSVSRTGALVYVPRGAGGGAMRSLVWVGRNGREEAIPAPPRAYQHPRLSPDDARLAVDIADQENDVWVWEFAHSNLTRLTFDSGTDQMPVWMPDGRRIVFVSNRVGPFNVFVQPADGTGTAERLTSSANNQFAPSMSADGTQIVVAERAPKTGLDLTLIHVGQPQSAPMVATTFQEFQPEVSPDGHWLAYGSDESGRQEIFVRPFPNVGAGRWQVSTGGGNRPVWARSGKELFYGTLDGSIMAVPVQTSPSFSYGSAVKLFDWRTLAAPGGGRTFDVSRDGQRFLMVKEAGGGTVSAAASSNIVVVLNWTEDLKTRVPTK